MVLQYLKISPFHSIPVCAIRPQMYGMSVSEAFHIGERKMESQKGLLHCFKDYIEKVSKIISFASFLCLTVLAETKPLQHEMNYMIFFVLLLSNMSWIEAHEIYPTAHLGLQIGTIFAYQFLSHQYDLKYTVTSPLFILRV